MGVVLKWCKQPPCGWGVVGTRLVLPLPPVLLRSSRPDKRNGFGSGLRSRLPQTCPFPPIPYTGSVPLLASLRSCAPKGEGFCPSGLYSTSHRHASDTFNLSFHFQLKKVKFAQT